jgi:hypothetical protein
VAQPFELVRLRVFASSWRMRFWGLPLDSSSRTLTSLQIEIEGDQT